MDAKVDNLNTTFLRGIIQVKLTKPFHTPNSIAKDHYQLMTQGHHSIKIQTKPKSLKVTICFYELIN